MYSCTSRTSRTKSIRVEPLCSRPSERWRAKNDEILHLVGEGRHIDIGATASFSWQRAGRDTAPEDARGAALLLGDSGPALYSQWLRVEVLVRWVGRSPHREVAQAVHHPPSGPPDAAPWPPHAWPPPGAAPPPQAKAAGPAHRHGRGRAINQLSTQAQDGWCAQSRLHAGARPRCVGRRRA